MRWQLPISCLLLLSCVAGCQPPGKSSGKLSGAGMDMFTPVKMRLHPLSRVVTSPLTVEARLEFTDQFGDVGKGTGEAKFQLFAYDPIAIDHEGRRIGEWSMGLSTPADNRARWDAITRTYLFKLTPDAAAAADHTRFVLACEFTLPNGEELSEQITLQAK